MASSAGGNVEAGGAAGAVAVWWVACSAASGWCRMLRAVVGGLDCGGLSLASSPLRTQVSCLDLQISYPSSQPSGDASWLRQTFNRPVPLRRAALRVVAGSSRCEAAVLPAADVLLMPSRRFMANISKVAKKHLCLWQNLPSTFSQLEIPDSELSSTYAGYLKLGICFGNLSPASDLAVKALILHKNAKELFRCRRCSAVVDTGAPIPIDDRRPPMGGGASALQVTPNSNTFVLDISSLDSSLWHYFPAD